MNPSSPAPGTRGAVAVRRGPTPGSVLIALCPMHRPSMVLHEEMGFQYRSTHASCPDTLPSCGRSWTR